MTDEEVQIEFNEIAMRERALTLAFETEGRSARGMTATRVLRTAAAYASFLLHGTDPITLGQGRRPQ